MNETKTLRAQIENQTGRELADLRYDDDSQTVVFFRKEFGDANYRKGKILLSEGNFDLMYVASKPYTRTVIKTAATSEDGVEVLTDLFARNTDMEVKDVQRQIENII